ncbi:MAG TPA: glycosyltransferase 87 family protein [Nitriliruptorales bacterium]|nr:glycosyltransferase 87 family protein [Nitriliruptorales bacterium]
MNATRTLGVATLAGLVVYGTVAALQTSGSGLGVYWAAVLGGTAVLAVGWAAAARAPPRTAVTAIVVGAALFRAVLVPTAPALSDDLYRYLWDGRVQAANIDPYAHPPDDPALAPLRDGAIHPEVNRPHLRTIYPGGAQLAFAASWRVGIRGPVALKALLAALDLLAVGLLVGLLPRLGRRRHLAVAYAWNPLAVLAVGHSGHVDVLVVLALLLATAVWQRDRPLAAGLLVGAAGAVKLFPLLVLPAFLRRPDGRFAWWLPLPAAAVVAVSYLPYLPSSGPSGARLLGILLHSYLGQEGYTSGRRFRVAFALGVNGWWLTAAVAAAVLVAVLRSQRPAPTRATWLLGAAILLTTPYPWYALPLVALAVAGGPGLAAAPRAAELLWPLVGVGLEAAYVGARSATGPASSTVQRWVAAAAAAWIAIAVAAGNRRPAAGELHAVGDRSDGAGALPPSSRS